MTQSIEETLQQYTAAWNLKEAEAIKAVLTKCWVPKGTYIDKNNDLVKGIDALTELILSSYKIDAARTFTLLSPPDAHHNCGRFYWQLNLPGQLSREGMDFFEYDNENCITRIVGFV